MSDEDNKALNTQAEEEVSQTPTPEVEPKATEEVETEKSTESDTLTNQQQSETNKGANQRIRELNERTKQAEERAKSLEERMKELTKQSSYDTYQAPPIQPNQPLVKPGEELSVEELEHRLQQREARLLQQVESRTNLQIQQGKVLENIQKESGEVMAIYPELNPDNKQVFDKDLSDSIVEATMAYVKSNPTGSVKTFVSRLMKPYQKSMNKQIANKTGEIVKQVAESATRPNQITKSEKPFSELSIKEMEEKLGMVN